MSLAEKELLVKARQSALLAVEIFNKPTVEFRVQTFIVLMHIAWNSLFLAHFHSNGIRPFYKAKNGYHYLRVDGEKKAWDLSTCMKKYWKGENPPVRKNLEFFVKLRNRIEHYRDQEVLILLTFGECQSLVTNFEELMVEFYGAKHSLVDSLALSLQLSVFRSEERLNAIMDAVDTSTSKITNFIKDFRSSLSDDIFSDTRYSHKLFLLPKTANHQSRDSLAIEWVNTDDLTEDEANQVETVLGIIKEKHVQVLNPGSLRPSQVCERVRDTLDVDPFTPYYHHAKCWKYFRVRPPTGAPNPEECNIKYCQYDVAHNDYLYTQAWVDLLVDELRDSSRYQEIILCQS